MNRLTLIVLAAVSLFGPTASAQKLDGSSLIGRWSGNGSFFKDEWQREFGAIPFVLECAKEDSVTGRVGGATLHDVRVRKTKGLIEVTAKLKGAITAHPGLDKDHLVLLITSLGDTTARAEFHLKSNAMLDPRMREGSVVLSRVR